MAWTEPRSRPDPELDPKPAPRSLKTQNTFPSAILPVQPPVLLPFLLLLAAFADLGTAGPPQPAWPPLLSGQPFIIFWGIRDSSCSGRPDPRSFGMEREGRVAVFYEDTLGNYPYFLDKDTPVNRGLPQHTRMQDHLQKTQQDVEAALPAPRYLGLGVLRWAEWVPQWSRNRERQAIYLDESRDLMKTFFPGWTPEEVEKWSKVGRDYKEWRRCDKWWEDGLGVMSGRGEESYKVVGRCWRVRDTDVSPVIKEQYLM